MSGETQELANVQSVATAPAPYSGRERRREHRRLIQAKATLTVLDGPSAQTTHEIVTRDLSISGICFLMKAPLHVGQTCRIGMANNGHVWDEQLCEVVRSRPLSNGKYEMAVKFRKQI